MSIRERIEEGRFLYFHDRWEGALLQVLIAVAATSRKRYPKTKIKEDGEAFRRFFDDGYGWRIGIQMVNGAHVAVAVDGEPVPMAQILYKWFRCALVHEGKLSDKVALSVDLDDRALTLRGGGDKSPMTISLGYIKMLADMVVKAPENADEFKEPPMLLPARPEAPRPVPAPPLPVLPDPLGSLLAVPGTRRFRSL